MEYTVSHFIKKYESIPEKYWRVNPSISAEEDIDLKSTCAMGFCGGYVEESKESMALAGILLEYYRIEKINPPMHGADIDFNAVVYFINDNYDEVKLPTPKQRILHALYTVRDKELSEANVKITEKIINTIPELVNV